MRRLLTGFLLLALLLSLQISQAFADREVEVRRLEITSATRINLGYAPAQDCTVGNTNAPYWAIGNFLLPPEEYKLAFDPTASDCANCPPGNGFKIHTIHIIMQTAEACTLFMSMDVENALFPTDPACPEPGPVLCKTPVYQVALPGAGLWDIGLPITCDCLPMGHWFLLSVEFLDCSCATGTIPDLITDAGPATLCTNWNNYGTGWYDMLKAYPTWPGDMIIFADAECCDPPIVGTEGKNWGDIKKLYHK